MLQRGAVANAFNEYGATPLHWVRRATCPKTRERRGSRVARRRRSQTLSVWTGFDWAGHRQAASEDLPAIAKLLLQYGAEPNSKACDGCTAVYPLSLHTLSLRLDAGGEHDAELSGRRGAAAALGVPRREHGHGQGALGGWRQCAGEHRGGGRVLGRSSMRSGGSRRGWDSRIPGPVRPRAQVVWRGRGRV
jgi:hypothetical protein